MSIRAKLLIPLILLAVLVLAAVHFIALAPLRTTLADESMDAEERALNLVALAILPDLLGSDLAKIHETLDTVARRNALWRSLTLTGPGGNRLYPISLVEPGRELAVITAPIMNGSRQIAVLAVSIDRDHLVAPTVDIVRELEGLVAVILILGTAFVIAVQRQVVIRPLLALADASRNLSEGHYHTALPAPSGDEVGRLVLAFTAMRDAVAEREAQLRRSEHRLGAVIDNSAEAIISVDESGRITSFNKVAEAMFGVAADGIVGRAISPLVDVMGLDGRGGIETEGRRIDGTSFPAMATATRVSMEGWSMMVITVVDLTHAKETEERLKESEGRFRDLAESASDWFWETDTEYRLTFVSERIGTILGVKPSAILGFTYFDVGLGEDDPVLARTHAEDLAARYPFRDVMFSIGPEGGKDGKIVRISGMPFFDPDGNFTGYRGIGADITREARAELRARNAQQQLNEALANQHAELERQVAERTEALEVAQREALHASRLASVGQLAAGIAHEINTPIQYIGDNLTFIQGATAEMIPLLTDARRLGADPAALDAFAGRFDAANLDFLMAEMPSAIEQSLEGVAQVARIVLSMKEFSHPGTTQKALVDINRALDSTIVVSRNTWKHIAQMETRFAADLPMVNCHPGEMNQVFLNLIVNAAHAIEDSGKPEPGRITIETARVDGFAEIRVSDSGTGVPDEIRERIFDPFFTTKEVGKGTGQGLAICYDVVVTKHGGQIIVGGQPGDGAIFTIRLPIDAPPSDPA